MQKLPILLKEIAEETSLKSAMEFAMEFGGQRIHIPKPQNMEKSKLFEKIPLEVMIMLCDRYAGETIEVPAWSARSLKARRARIIKLLKEGKSLNQIAKETGATIRTVSNIKKNLKQQKDDK